MNDPPLYLPIQCLPTGKGRQKVSSLLSYFHTDSYTELEHVEELDEEARVRLAISALGSMRDSVPPSNPNHYHPYGFHPVQPSNSSYTSSNGTSTPPTASSITGFNGSGTELILPEDPQEQERFLERVSQFPLVSGAIKAYEGARNSNRVVRVSFYPMQYQALKTVLNMSTMSTV